MESGSERPSLAFAITFPIKGLSDMNSEAPFSSASSCLNVADFNVRQVKRATSKHLISVILRCIQVLETLTMKKCASYN